MELSFAKSTQSTLGTISSFGSLKYVLSLKRNESKLISTAELFQDFIENLQDLAEANDYRDYLVHQENINMSISTSKEQEVTSFTYLMPTKDRHLPSLRLHQTTYCHQYDHLNLSLCISSSLPTFAKQ